MFLGLCAAFASQSNKTLLNTEETILPISFKKINFLLLLLSNVPETSGWISLHHRIYNQKSEFTEKHR